MNDSAPEGVTATGEAMKEKRACQTGSTKRSDDAAHWRSRNNGGEGEKDGDNDGEIGTKAISTQAIRERRRSLCLLLSCPAP